MHRMVREGINETAPPPPANFDQRSTSPAKTTSIFCCKRNRPRTNRLRTHHRSGIATPSSLARHCAWTAPTNQPNASRRTKTLEVRSISRPKRFHAGDELVGRTAAQPKPPITNISFAHQSPSATSPTNYLLARPRILPALMAWEHSAG